MQLALKGLLILCFLGLSGIGCGKRSDNSQKQDIVLDSYRLIDEQRTDEAISLLENSLQSAPEKYEYQSVLASAYAHKAGVKVQKLVSVLQQTSKNQLPSVSSENDSVENSGLKIASILLQLSKYFHIFAAIPKIESENVIYLEHAIDILNKLGNNIKKEDALYRAVLEVILFKNIFTKLLVGESSSKLSSSLQSCQVDLAGTNHAISDLGKILIDIYNDIGFVFPDQAENMKNLAQQTSQTVIDISNTITTVTTLNEAATLFLKQSIIENGFGKILKCGGS